MSDYDASTPMQADPNNFVGAPPWREMARRGYLLGERFPKDTAYVGKHLGSTLIKVTPERVAEYIRRTDDDHPYYTVDSPFGGPCAPATLFTSHSSVEFATWGMPNMHGNLHAQTEWEFYAPIMVGDEVLAVRTVVGRYAKRNRIYMVCEVNFTRTSNGQLLARQRHHQSFVDDQSAEAIAAWHNGTSGKMTGKKGSGQVIAKGRTKIQHPDAEGEVVEKFGPVRRVADQHLCERFAGAKAGVGYGNGHLDEKEASGMGFPDIVVVGVLSISLLSELMTKRFGRGFLEGGSMNLKLVRPLWMGDTVEAWGVVRRWEYDGPQRRRAICDIWCYSADGTVTIVGSTTACEITPLARM